MPQPELLARVLAILDANAIPYMVSGSIVSSLQGQPRSTHDIDVVVVMTPGQARAVCQAFADPRYYVSDAAALEAIQRRGMFNLLDVDTGDKVDFWILGDTAFDQSRFSRRHRDDIDGVPAFVSRPEDTILQKLRWADLSGGSEKQTTDCVGVYEVQYGRLDQQYLDLWATRLGVTQGLAEVRRRAEVE
jgi:hypothetical protein